MKLGAALGGELALVEMAELFERSRLGERLVLAQAGNAGEA